MVLVGKAPTVVAELFGYQSAGQMIEALQNTGKRKDVIEQENKYFNDGALW